MNTATRCLAACVLAAVPVSVFAESPKVDLPKAITDAGYKFKTLDDGAHEIVINAKEQWNFYVSPSRDGQLVWMEFPCTKIKGTPHPDDLMKLLNENNRSGPSFFAVGKDGQIRIWKTMASSELTADRLKDELNDLRDFALRTEILWDTNNWRKESASK